MSFAGFWGALRYPIIGLAPMDGVTDAAFRWIVADQAPPDVTFTEFTNVQDICSGPDHLLRTLVYSERERPIVAQVYGKDPTLFYRAAHVVCELGFDGLDINMGCPSKNVANSGAGAGLIRTPELAHAIMRAARQGIEDWAAGQTLDELELKPMRRHLIGTMNVARTGHAEVCRRRIPLSVKTRLGYDAIVVESWIAHLLRERPTVISVHGRTLAQMYRGAADWTAIRRAAELVRGTETRLLGNGDVQSMVDVVRRVRETGVHGVLVGRGTLGSPWFFRAKELARAAAAEGVAEWVPPADAAGRERSWVGTEPPLAERFRVMLTHARYFESTFGRERFPRMRKHLGWYCKGFPGAAAMRGRMVRATGSHDVSRLVADYLAASPESAVSATAAALVGAPCLSAASS